MKSFFITGTDTDVGKTWIAAGLARAFRNMGIDVGIMKPFAAGNSQKTGFKSEDAEILSKAAKVNDPENLVNPQFFPIPASPYTAMKNSNVFEKVNVDLILQNFKKLSKLHDSIIVEGMGGIMTPILKNYYITNLINDLNLEIIIITRTRIGTLNHTIMTCKMAKKYGLHVRGIIINQIDLDGYDVDVLKDDIEEITGFSVLGTVPFLKNFDVEQIANIFQTNFDLKSLT
ncbi:MAG: ATP-dependent dethiobiotin synthetase BioD [Nitrosopumilales archaeon]|nr:MAG: ATP-dependent dethiobiotin synthetase BioD [Nitrosopumilales archaeon]